ncbi:Glutathione S-transferase U9 [Vitis vinifera]|uniref:Glutathione S-transferase U9 n=1 Tax=Vitis vinifera TaxID=29760 RepID=A0A438GXH4_VITVI|nr:Glutathione S-transferase U9 [Vitis vinifera]
MLLVIKSDGKAQEKAIKVVFEKLKLFEEDMKDFFQAREEALGVKFIDPEIYPPVCSWVTALTELAVVKEFRPPHEKLVEILQFVRQSALQSSAASSS